MALAPGTFLGPYEVLARLGEGGMGEVWKARDTRLGRLVAIKRLKDAHTRRFQDEARAIAALNHPHICQIYDVGPDYLVLEYVAGKPIGGPLEFESALRFALQITEALEEAHRLGILHRDLKPANILVTEGGSVKLLDFGLAKVLRDDTPDVTRTMEGTVAGTPAYMAPEQARGDAVDVRSDIFSFGVVFYEILSGRRAFPGASQAEVLAAVLRDDPAPIETHPVLQPVVKRCLMKQASARFQTAAELRRALQQVVPGPSVPLPASHIPVPPTPLIGRQSELADVRALLPRADTRLVSLTGPPGIGKTRLAIEISRLSANDFEQIWFVELEGVLEPHRVPFAILHGIGLREQDGRSSEICIAEHIQSRDCLLVLDNFEQVADAAPFLAHLLSVCPRLTILATTRARLHLRAEHEYSVQPLATRSDAAAPHQLADIPAVALFLERGSIVNPTPETLQAISEICAHLDGLPLAIELAAARTRLLSPQAMLPRLRNRFQWLRGGPRDLPERQRALRDAIDWSYDLLASHEKQLMHCLSIFAAAPTLDAVDAVCEATEDTLELLTALADKSFLIKQEDSRGNVRIRLLETIREYARERLEQQAGAATVRNRHALYYLAAAGSIPGERTSTRPPELFDALEDDQENCLAALDWFLANRDADSSLRMVIALWPFWEARGYWTEGRGQLRRVLSATSGAGQPELRSKALYAAGVLADAQGDYAAARKAFEDHLAIQRAASNPAALAAAVNNLGITALRQGDYSAARNAYQEVLQILRSLGSQISVAQCLNNLGHVAMAEGDYGTARSNYQESLALCRQLRSTRDMAWTLSSLGDVAREESRFEEGEVLYSQSLGLFRQIDDRAGLASCLADLGNLAVLRQQGHSAARLFQESLVIFGDLGDKRGIVRTLEGFAMIASARQRPDVALQLAGAASAVRAGLGWQGLQAHRSRMESAIAAWRLALGTQAENAWQEGKRMHLQQAIEHALATAAF